MDFTGRTVIVTGGSRGLGRAIAVSFARAGAYVYVGFRVRADLAAETLRAVESQGGAGKTLGFDVRSRQAVDDAVESVLRERDGIDVVVNNAGVARDGLAGMMSSEEWEDGVAVNLTGGFHLGRAGVRPMMAKGRGAIVNVGSVAGGHASVGQVNYAASKGGVLALTRTLAAELAPYGVRVNAVVPGLIGAGMAERMDRRILERRKEHIPIRRLGTPEEVAKAVLFLASGVELHRGSGARRRRGLTL